MEGSLANREDFGVIPRSAQAIFEQLDKEEMKYESFAVYCSYLEIYNEDLCDLLSDENANKQVQPGHKLEIMEGKNGPFCRGLSEKEVKSAADVLLLMQKAQQQKKVGETNMNKSSSRSHCIFTIRVHAKRRLEDGALFESKGKLHMVDLAGSECAKTANMEDGGHEQAARERERMNINRSLLTLGRVVKILKEQSTSKKKTNARIPYRDSKLTRILQQSLGGTCKTCIVATLSPSETAIEESISTLNYAQSAHGIINKPISASYMSQGTASSAIFAAGESCKGSASVGTIEHWNEMECRLEYMQAQVEEAKAALARKHLQQQELIDTAEKAAAEKVEVEQRLEQSEKKKCRLESELVSETEQRLAAQAELSKTRNELERTTLVLQATQQTEAYLTKEAMALINALKQSIKDGDELYQIVVSNRNDDVKRKRTANEFNALLGSLLDGVKETLIKLSDQEQLFCAKSTETITANTNKELLFVKETKQVVQAAVECINTAVSTMKSYMEGSDGIISSAKAMNGSIATRIDHARSVVEDGEQELKAYFASIREKLENSGSRLGKLEKLHNESAEMTVNILTKHVDTSKQEVQNLIKSTCEALEELQQQREKMRRAIKETIEQWRSNVTDSGNYILEQSRGRYNTVEERLNSLNSEMQRHETIAVQLREQILLLQKDRKTSAVQYESQRSLIQETTRELEKSHDKQNEALSMFVKNVLEGVHELVQTQMAEVLKGTKESHDAIMTRSTHLVEKHVSITNSSLKTLHTAESISDSIQKETDAVKNMDIKIVNHLDETQSVLRELQNVATKQVEDVEVLSAQTCRDLKKLHELEAGDGKICEELNSGGKDIEQIMSHELLQDTQGNILALRSCGESVVSFIRDDVIRPMSKAVNDIERPRKHVMEQFAQDLSAAKEAAKEGSTNIAEKAVATVNAADQLKADATAVETEFMEITAEARIADLEEARESVLQCTNEYSEASQTAINKSQSKATKAMSAIEEFVLKGLSAKEEVATVPEKKWIDFSDRLSATPAAEAIFEMLEQQNDNTDEADSGTAKLVDGNGLSVDSESTSNSDTTKSYDGCGKPVLKPISPNEDNAAKKRSRKSISTTPIKHSPGRKPPQRRPSRLALPKATTSMKRAKR